MTDHSSTEPEPPATLSTESALRFQFRPVRPQRVFEVVCARIREQIVAGELRPGDRLAGEKELATQFGVSRMAIKEAFRALETTGVIRLEKGVRGGAFINSENSTLLTQSIEDWISLGDISVEDLTETRGLIYTEVVRLASKRADQADFDALDAILRDLDQHFVNTPSSMAISSLASQFACRLAQATRNKMLVLLVTSLTDITREVTNRRGRSARPELQAIRKQIVKHLKARDETKAVKEIRRYVDIVHRDALARGD